MAFMYKDYVLTMHFWKTQIYHLRTLATNNTPKDRGDNLILMDANDLRSSCSSTYTSFYICSSTGS